MCKICKKDNLIMIGNNRTTEETVYILNIVKEYTGEFCCMSCKEAIRLAKVRKDTSYDNTILSLLKLHYITKAFGPNVFSSANRKMLNIPKTGKRKRDLKPRNTKYTLIEKYIHEPLYSDR